MVIQKTSKTTDNDYAPNLELFDKKAEGIEENIDYQISTLEFDFSLGSKSRHKYV